MKGQSFPDIAVILSATPLPPHQVTGWADGDDVLKLARLADAATHKIGAAGNMSVAINADRSGEITLKLFATSPTNKYLNDVLILQSNTRTWAPISVTFQDLTRLDSAVSVAGYIKKLPEIMRGAGVNTQEWVIVCANLAVVLANPAFAGFNQLVAEAAG